MANSHIQQSGINYRDGSLGIPNSNYIKRSKKKNKGSQNLLSAHKEQKILVLIKKKFDLETKKLWR